MSRIRDDDLGRLDTLLTQLRTMGQLQERRRGTFTRGSAASLHFYAFTSGLAADLKSRRLVASLRRRAGRWPADLLRDVRRVLRGQTEELAGEPT